MPPHHALPPLPVAGAGRAVVPSTHGEFGGLQHHQRRHAAAPVPLVARATTHKVLPTSADALTAAAARTAHALLPTALSWANVMMTETAALPMTRPIQSSTPTQKNNDTAAPLASLLDTLGHRLCSSRQLVLRR